MTDIRYSFVREGEHGTRIGPAATIGRADRLAMIRDLAGDDLALVVNMDLTRGYPQPLPGKRYHEVGVKAGMTVSGNGYPKYGEARK